ALCGFVGINFVLFAFANAPMANVAWLGALPYAALWGMLINRDRMSGKELLALFASVVGAIGMMLPLHASDLSFGVGEMAAMIGNALLAISMVVSKRLVEESNHSFAHLWSSIGLALLSLPIVLFLEGLPPMLSMSKLSLLVIGGALWATNGMLVIFGFSHLKAGVANGIIALEGVWSLLFGYLYFVELPTSQSIIGGALITLSALAMSMLALKRRCCLQES
ncbi:MAG: DMT family transporter, partial [Bdellovibrionales bacterium]|nr:DMT family transporter [Bdellovibrionales bacterium]